MKKLSVLSVLLMFSAGLLSAQETVAPDQGEPASAETNVVVTNTVATNTPAVSTNAVVTQEKEVTSSEGVVYSDGKNNYVSSDAKFEINATDQGSGVKTIWVMVDNSAFGEYSAPVSVTAEGRHLLAYKVEDNVGNISPVKTYEFYMDLTAPEVSVQSSKKWIAVGDALYVALSNELSLSASDNLSGVSGIEYSLDGGEWNKYDAPISTELSNGLHKLSYRAEDNVGNQSVVKTTLFFVDKNAPTVKIVPSVALYTNGDKNYTGAQTSFAFSATDKGTGVQMIVYSIDGGTSVEYTHPIKLAAGVHTISAQAIDMVGNKSAKAEITVEVDADTPEANIVPEK